MQKLGTETLKPTPLFHPETGIATDEFKNQLKLVGIVVKQIIDSLPSDHAENVNETLQKYCFQEDYDLFKNGGDSDFKINYAQAASYLDNIYSLRRKILPDSSSEPVDGILGSGVKPSSIPATLSKRFKSLKVSIVEKGLKYETIYVHCKNEEIKICSIDFITNLQIIDEQFAKINFEFIVANVDRNIAQACVKKMHHDETPKRPYVIITDATSAQKDYLIATTYPLKAPCHGIALVPITSWTNEMNLYGYEKALGSHKKAAIAWARSDWNFVARRSHMELKALNKKVHS